MAESEILDYTDEFKELQKHLDESSQVSEVLSDIEKEGGISQQHVADLENAIPGSIMSNFPEGGFTDIPSTQNLDAAMESLSTVTKFILGGAFLAILAILFKIFGSNGNGAYDKEEAKSKDKKAEAGEEKVKKEAREAAEEARSHKFTPTPEQEKKLHDTVKTELLRIGLSETDAGTIAGNRNSIMNFFAQGSAYIDRLVQKCIEKNAFAFFVDRDSENKIAVYGELAHAAITDYSSLTDMLAQYIRNAEGVIHDIESKNPVVRRLYDRDLAPNVRGVIDRQSGALTGIDPYKATMAEKARALGDQMVSWFTIRPRNEIHNLPNLDAVLKRRIAVSLSASEAGQFCSKCSKTLQAQTNMIKRINERVSNFYQKAQGTDGAGEHLATLRRDSEDLYGLMVVLLRVLLRYNAANVSLNNTMDEIDREYTRASAFTQELKQLI